jgi:hypothetical protein
MQPPAEVEPARISHGRAVDLSSSAMLKMSAARAVSRLENAHLAHGVDDRAGVELTSMSMCSTTCLQQLGLACWSSERERSSLQVSLEVWTPVVENGRPPSDGATGEPAMGNCGYARRA